MKTQSNENRLKIRDLATMGIFAAVLMLFTMLAGLITGIVPVLFLFAPTVFALLSGPVFMTVAVKVGKPGAVFITALIVGILWTITGSVNYLISFAVFGILAELVAALSRYKSMKWLTVSYVLFAFGYYMGALGAIYFFLDYYIKIGTEVAQMPMDFLMGIVNAVRSWLSVPAVLGTVLAAIGSALLGKRILRKHFVKAGVV